MHTNLFNCYIDRLNLYVIHMLLYVTAINWQKRKKTHNQLNGSTKESCGMCGANEIY